MSAPSSTFDADELLGWVKTQASFGARRAGSPAGRASEDWLHARLTEFGLHTHREPLDVTSWAPTRASLQVEGAQALEAFAAPFSKTTPAEGLSGPLVFADRSAWFHGGDWRGAIVVCELGFPPLDLSLLLRIASGVHDPDGSLSAVRHPATWVRLGWHLYRLACERGAAGFVGVLVDQPGGGCQMYAPYGFKERDILDKPLPALWVSKKHRDALKAAARAGARATLVSEATRGPATSDNIVGVVEGQSRETLVLSCHHDSPFESPVEDATGVAVVLALARHYAKRRSLRRRLVVLVSAGHFYGSIGTRSYIERHREDVVRDTVCEISIEHLAREAVESADGSLVPSGYPEATGFFVPFNRAVSDVLLTSLKRHDVRRSVLLPAEGPLGDYPPTDGGDWWEAGVPVINCISNPVYLLTNDDALKWADGPRMAQMTQAFVDVIDGLDRLPREAIAAVDSKPRRWLMTALKHVARAKTTRFGTTPVY